MLSRFNFATSAQSCFQTHFVLVNYTFSFLSLAEDRFAEHQRLGLKRRWTSLLETTTSFTLLVPCLQTLILSVLPLS